MQNLKAFRPDTMEPVTLKLIWTPSIGYYLGQHNELPLMVGIPGTRFVEEEPHRGLYRVVVFAYPGMEEPAEEVYLIPPDLPPNMTVAASIQGDTLTFPIKRVEKHAHV